MLLLLLILFYPGKNVSQTKENYSDAIRKIVNDTLFSHFSMGVHASIFYGSTGYSDFENFEYSLFIDKEDDSKIVYDTIVNFVEKNAIKVYDVNDTSLFVLLPYSLYEGKVIHEEEQENERIMKGNFTRKDMIPIPGVDYQFDSWDQTPNGWDKNIKLYVLGAQPGEYLNDKFLYKGDRFLPSQWRHGYSRGIAIDEKNKEIYYWLVIW